MPKRGSGVTPTPRQQCQLEQSHGAHTWRPMEGTKVQDRVICTGVDSTTTSIPEWECSTYESHEPHYWSRKVGREETIRSHCAGSGWPKDGTAADSLSSAKILDQALRKVSRSVRDMQERDPDYHDTTATHREEETSKEKVKHPSHYNTGKIETWDYIIDQGLSYCLGDAVKYISRAGKKDPTTRIQDLEKAKAFIDREIQRFKDEDAFEGLETTDPVAFDMVMKGAGTPHRILLCSRDRIIVKEEEMYKHLNAFHPESTSAFVRTS